MRSFERLDFENSVLKNQIIVKGEQVFYYNKNKYKQKVYFDILNYISEHVTLVQIIYSLGNMNNDIGVVGYWIFESNYEKALVLNI